MSDRVVESLAGALVASCQPVPGGPTDSVDFVVAFALAAIAGGARGLRIEGVRNVEAVATATGLPIIGLVKRDLTDSAVRITPFVEDAVALARAGARIVAFDATDRARPTPVRAMVQAIHDAGALAMADISSLDEAKAALATGADIVGTTLSGYVGPGPVPDGPDIALVSDCARLGLPVFAEGRLNTPDLAAAARRAGATAVVVGSAITRPEYIAEWFSMAIAAASPRTVLALDIGGTKSAAALVRDGRILRRAETPTLRDGDPEAWLDGIAQAVEGFDVPFTRVSAAVSGLITEGSWSAVNPAVLPVPDRFPLVRALEKRFGLPARALNDAQAAAWGEHRRGAGRGRDMMFVTVSSGVGAGLVVNGRLVTGRGGLAGHLGQIRPGGDAPVEEGASGFAIARAATAAGHPGDARAVTAAAGRGEAWAERILRDATQVLAGALVNVQRLVDPEVVVIGGGVGLSPGYLPRLQDALAAQPNLVRPIVVAAGLGADAGLIGAAEYEG